MKEAQAERQSQGWRQAWHINLCQSPPAANPKCSHKTRKLAQQERNSSTCHVGISVSLDTRGLEEPLRKMLPIQSVTLPRSHPNGLLPFIPRTAGWLSRWDLGSLLQWLRSGDTFWAAEVKMGMLSCNRHFSVWLLKSTSC